MQLTIANNEVTIIGSNIVGFEQSNMVASITGTVDTEEGWDFTLLIQRVEDGSVDQIFFTRQDNVIYVVLTANMLPISGRYIGQFQISQGMMVGLTNQFEFWVENTVNLEDAFTPIPTAFLQLATNVRILYEHPPTPGDNGYWMIWNPTTGEYEQSDIAVSALPIASATTLGGVKIGEGVNVTEDGTISVSSTGGSGITQEEADARYLQLAGGTMDGNVDMGSNNINNVSFIKASGNYDNAGIRFNGSGTIIDFITGYSTALELSANSVNAMNHRLDNVADIEMSNNSSINNVQYVGRETDIVGRNAIEFGNEYISFWVNGHLSMTVYDTNINASGYRITGLPEPTGDSDAATKQYVDNVVAGSGGGETGGITQEQADARYLQLTGGTMTGSLDLGNQQLLNTTNIVNGDVMSNNTSITLNNGYIAFDIAGNRILSIYGSAINAVNHRIQNVSDPQDNTDAANKLYVDTSVSNVQTNINTLSTTVDDILEGTEPIPYLSDDGGTLNGPLNMGNNKITIQSTPTEATDVPNKQYVDNAVSNIQTGGGGVPIGTIISLMGTTAPNGYLVCDGTTYDITTYTELSTYFTEQFGSSNYFGGDGTMTFSVPDLRGEFLRGSGTNSHENQGNGADVGVHQDSTWASYFTPTSNGMSIMYDASFNNLINNYDSIVNKSDGIKAMRNFEQATASNPSNQDIGGTIRPTNTAVLYCIKYTNS